MKKTILTASMLLTAAIATPASAEEGKGSLGIGSYALAITATDSTGEVSSTMTGIALVGEYGITDLLSVAGHLYSVTGDLTFNPDITLGLFTPTINTDGFDVMLKLGHTGKGFTYFGALGYFSETQEFVIPSVTVGGGTVNGSTTSTDYSDFLLGYGIGYNWESVALTFEGSIRSTKDYQGNDTGSMTAATGALNVSYRF